MPKGEVGTPLPAPKKIMALEGISRRSYPEPDRNEVQERIARAIEADPEPFFARYLDNPQSFEGRYVCSDLFKETFPEFSASPAARARYNNPVHNSAAVLASEQFRRMVENNPHPEQDTVIFLTGVPGAGKTTAVLTNDRMDANTRVVYEGQLARPATVILKIQQVLDAGMTPLIVAVHTPSELALVNTLKRFEREGRGASIEAMASIQGGLPEGLAVIQEHFGDAVRFQLFDRRRGMNNTVQKEGWEYASKLLSEGDYEHIKHRLHAALEQHEATGTFSPDAIRQARGQATLARNQELSAPDGGQPQHAQPGRPQGQAQEAVGQGPQETARAESAQARAIEADQARLQSQATGERYQSALQTYLQANTQRIERIENRLETLVENQQAALDELEAHQPGFLASRRAKAEWSAEIGAAQDRLQTLNKRLSRLEEIKEQSAELAEEKMREQEPELAKAWDTARRAERSSQEQQRQARQTDRARDRSMEQGRELEI